MHEVNISSIHGTADDRMTDQVRVRGFEFQQLVVDLAGSQGGKPLGTDHLVDRGYG